MNAKEAAKVTAANKHKFKENLDIYLVSILSKISWHAKSGESQLCVSITTTPQAGCVIRSSYELKTALMNQLYDMGYSVSVDSMGNDLNISWHTD